VFQYDFSFSDETHRIAICDEPRIPFIVIASASEAIQGHEKILDCFIASAPRNDGS
jgi:hypothetical protein